MMTVEGKDGQQYVVLQVIQVADNQGADQQMTIVANEDGDLDMQAPLRQEIEILNGTGGKEDKAQEIKLPTSSKSSFQHTQNDSKLQKEMETCFSFDEEEEKGETNVTPYILRILFNII